MEKVLELTNYLEPKIIYIVYIFLPEENRWDNLLWASPNYYDSLEEAKRTVNKYPHIKMKIVKRTTIITEELV